MNANTTMTTNDSGRRNRPRKAGRHGAYSGSRDREIWKRSIARDQDGTTQEDAAFGSPRAAFVAGAKTTAPVLVALVPFALAFGTMTVGGGLSTLEALAMSLFVFAGAVVATDFAPVDVDHDNGAKVPG